MRDMVTPMGSPGPGKGNRRLIDRERVEAARRAVAAAPEDEAALTALFVALDAIGEVGAPPEAVARVNMGDRLRRAGRAAEAESHLRAAIAWLPGFGGGHFNLGVLHQAAGRFEEAFDAYGAAAALMPEFPGAVINQAAMARELGRAGETIAVVGTALGRGHGNQPALWANLGAAALDLGDAEKAAGAFRRLLALAPAMGEGWSNLATALRDLGDEAGSLTCMDRALGVGVADAGGVLAQRVQRRRRLCLWDGLAADSARLRDIVAAGASSRIHPWIFLGEGAGRAMERRCAARYGAWRTVSVKERRVEPLPATMSHRSPDGPLRIGYLSSDFQEHATAVLMAELLERHDRSRVAINAYSHGRDDGGPMRRRLRAACDVFRDVTAMSSEEAATLIRDDGVHILVDLKGHTQGARPAIPALRPAPIVVQWLGYPGTMGVDFVDYILADPVVAPFEHAADYDERIVHLPDCYQPNDRLRAADPTPRTRADHGLPATGFVFCCFNSSYKINPEVYGIWMDILKSVPESVLWLMADASEIAVNLRREAAARGVDGGRLILAPKSPAPEYLARYRHADLFLDTWPVGAHTTASDALWMGTPVLTRLGDAFAGRVGASLLDAVGLPETITRSVDDYRDAAVALATTRRHELAGFGRRLAAGRAAARLFDTDRFAGHLEDAYAAMWGRFACGLPAESFAVPARA